MLTQLQVHHLRNIKQVSVSTAQCNVVIGDNGSGKTSLLEAIYLLAHGKSFRHHQPKRYITHHQPNTTIFAKFADGGSMAIQKQQDAHTTLRLNGQPVLTQSQLSIKLPILLIDPSSMDVLDTGTSNRRKLLDWLTFHVKPEFHVQWVAYQKLLKQRNAFLKQCQRLSQNDKQELAAWDAGLANHANLITHHRQAVFAQWQVQFAHVMQKLLPNYAHQITLKFVVGYDDTQPLNLQLAHRLPQDVQLGYTRMGCHRADVQILWSSESTKSESIKNATRPSGTVSATAKIQALPIMEQDERQLREQATNVLSRGEKKLLITALKLSQLMVIAKTEESSLHARDTTPIVLLDDVTAELDADAIKVLLDCLAHLPCQLFVTSLDKSVLSIIQKYWTDIKLFHMKQGELQALSSC